MHNFWVLAYGDFRKAWSETDVERYETRRAVSRNTFTLYPGSWTAIRVKFDNPGVAHFRTYCTAKSAPNTVWDGFGLIADLMIVCCR